MQVKNNYNDCLTNLACSIRKYFNLEYNHNTIEDIDKLLEEYKPKNVVTILCDGMGYNIMNRVLNDNAFLRTNTLRKITSVFPATTVAATTSVTTGLNPCESAMLGWNMYFKEIDKTITTFFCYEKTDIHHKPLKEALEYKSKHMKTKTIMNEINEKGEFKAYGLFPFGDHPYKSVKEMYRIIEKRCNEEGKKYIYAYNTEPDHTMHILGNNSEEVNRLILGINKDIKLLSKKLKDTIIFVIADHGHINVENIHLEDYPDIISCLSRNTSIEQRAVNFFIKEDKKELFKELFNKYFSNDFDLYDMEDVIESKLFGDGKENEIFRDCLGDYLAIAKGNKTLINTGDDELKSHHAGYTDDELFIPLIVINNCK